MHLEEFGVDARTVAIARVRVAHEAEVADRALPRQLSGHVPAVEACLRSQGLVLPKGLVLGSDVPVVELQDVVLRLQVASLGRGRERQVGRARRPRQQRACSQLQV